MSSETAMQILDPPRAATAWTDNHDPRPLAPIKPRYRPGPWTDTAGQPMTGSFSADVAAGLVDGVALWHGWCAWRWRAPRLGYQHPLLSPMNIVIGNGLAWDCDAPHQIRCCPDRALPGLMLDGLKPYAYFEQRGQGTVFTRRAQTRNLAVHIDRDPNVPGYVWITAARRERFGDLFDLGALAAAYRAALHAHQPAAQAADLYAEHVAPVLGIAHESPADYLDDFPRLENSALAITGLALGYAPAVTAGYLIAEPRISAEQGCYPEPPPNPYGDDFARLVRIHLDRSGHADYLNWLTNRGVEFDNAHLETTPGLVYFAFRRCWETLYQDEATHRGDPGYRWERCRTCHEANFVSAAYDWLAVRGVRPEPLGDDSYNWNTCLNRWGLPQTFLNERSRWAEQAADHDRDCRTCGVAAS